MASKAAADVDTDDGSLTPSEPSDGERSEHDSDYETEHEEETEGWVFGVQLIAVVVNQ